MSYRLIRAFGMMLLSTATAAGCVGSAKPKESGAGGTDGGGRDILGIDLNWDGGSQDNNGTDPTDFSSCATSITKVEMMPLDMGLLVDTSASMDFDDKWTRVSGALAIVTETPQYTNMGMALQYFPLRLACDVASYEAPDVTMGILPDVGQALRDSLSRQRMSGGTPLVQALQGMGSYLAAWAKEHPERRAVLVVATDGIPDTTCAGATPPNSLDEAVKVAGELATGTLAADAPKVPVFVIGVGSELAALDSIALAGGSTKATLIAAGADVARQFIDALDAIRRQSLTCDYAVPHPNGASLNLNAVNVTFTENGTTETFVKTGSAADCDRAAGKGWYFDDPTAPTRVSLCADVCQRVSASTQGKIDVVYGCNSVVIP